MLQVSKNKTTEAEKSNLKATFVIVLCMNTQSRYLSEWQHCLSLQNQAPPLARGVEIRHYLSPR